MAILEETARQRIRRQYGGSRCCLADQLHFSQQWRVCVGFIQAPVESTGYQSGNGKGLFRCQLLNTVATLTVVGEDAVITPVQGDFQTDLL